MYIYCIYILLIYNTGNIKINSKRKLDNSFYVYIEAELWSVSSIVFGKKRHDTELMSLACRK